MSQRPTAYREPPSCKPVVGTPLLLVTDRKRTLVATDIHVGLSRDGGPMGDSLVGGPADLAERLLGAARARRAGRVLLLGDVKEPILGARGGVRGELWTFFEILLGAGLQIEVCRGNHDVGLDRVLPPNVRIHSSRGVLRDGIGYFHGHAWPSEAILRRASTLVVGHLHPGFRLASGKQPCWIRCRPEGDRSFRASEIVVLPAFNPLCSSEALNLERPRRSRSFLVRRFLSQGESRAYLLDGTDLGPIEWGDLSATSHRPD